MGPLLELKGIKKSFNGNYVLKGVDLTLNQSECLSLVGENGAGKSTLMKILSGVWPEGSFEGNLFINGQAASFHSPLDARLAGISIIHQELCLFPMLSVAENLLLTERQPFDGTPSDGLLDRIPWRLLNQKAQNLLDELEFPLKATRLVSELSVAEKQLVEIARAFHHQSKVIILDEPTSALTKKETEALFSIIDKMQSQHSFIYISHKLDEIFRICDRISVLRDGQTVGELYPQTCTQDDIIQHMVGRPLTGSDRISTAGPNAILIVDRLQHRNDSGKSILKNISFSVNEGEIVGIAGLMGSGRTELLRSIAGALDGVTEGEITYLGKRASWHNIQESLSASVALLPEDRKKDGLFLDQSVGFNITISVLSSLLSLLKTLRLNDERIVIRDLIEQMQIRCHDSDAPVRRLSGGNQQKVLMARLIANHPKLLLLDEPTRGIDVGAKEEIYNILCNLAAAGMSLLVASSELPELLELCDRVLVMKEGQLMADLPNVELTQLKIMSYAAGDSPHG